MTEKGNGRENIKLIINLLISLVILLLCIFLLPRLVVFLMPFVIGWIISCIANPPVAFLERKLKIRRKAGTVVVIICVIAAVTGIIYGVGVVLFRQILGFVSEVPTMWAAVQQDFDNLGRLIARYVDISMPKFTDAISDIGVAISEGIKNLTNHLDFSAFEGMGSMVGSIASVIISTIMCMLSAYFFIADREWVNNAFDKYMPKSIAHKFDVFVSSIKQAVGGYFKAQLRIEVWMYLLLVIGFTVLKVKYTILIALLVAFLDILPFFGTGIVLVPWAVVSVIGGNYLRALGFLVIWGVGQLFRQLIQPKIMGDSIGMEPIPTLFLLFIGYKIAGVGGMLLAVPIGIIVVNMNEAGFFDTPKYSLKLLIKNINSFRRLDEEELKRAGKED
ncbi:MAG: sporulation integral membrane protein YtvI [Lachnospiraceae bacterium]|nr:sporulation integral membrane protein YtvI [Lachnospiraceae bacterium]